MNVIKFVSMIEIVLKKILKLSMICLMFFAVYGCGKSENTKIEESLEIPSIAKKQLSRTLLITLSLSFVC